MNGLFFRRIISAFALVLMTVTAQLAHARAELREGFSFRERGDVKIVVFRPDVHVGSLKVGGLDEPNAEWTADARQNIQAAMEANAQARAARMEFLDELEGENADLLNSYRGLFEAVSGSVFLHMALGDRLPTKTELRPGPDGRGKKIYKLDWTLGPGASRLRDVTGADYAMFVFTHDSYGDAGRKVAQVLMAGLFGAYMPAGVHIGYAGLVDLRTGDIVWFNTDLAMGGDPRKSDGAEKRVGQLLEGFPEHVPAAVSAAGAVQQAAPAAETGPAEEGEAVAEPVGEEEPEMSVEPQHDEGSAEEPEAEPHAQATEADDDAA